MAVPRSRKVTLQSAAGATGNGTPIVSEDLGSVTCQVTGTFVGTVTWEGTVDGTNWAAVRAEPLSTGTLATTATTTGLYRVACAGLHQVRGRVSAYTSGAITVTAMGTTASP